MTSMSQWLLGCSVIGLVAIGIIYMVWSRRTKKNPTSSPLDFGTVKPSWQMKYDEISQKAYSRSTRIPVVKGLIQRLRMRIETMAVYDEYSLRREVMRIVFSIAALVTIIVLLLIAIRPSWLIVFWVFLGFIFLLGVLIDFFVYRVESRLLTQLKDFNSRVRYFYQQTKMVDESIFDAIQFVGPEMKNQAERIHNILMSVDPEEELSKYEEVAPSRFLKIVAGLAVQVKDQGDVFSERGSSYLWGLASINQQINAEIMYRSKLSYRMRGLSALALIPIFFALPIQNWAISTFPIMKSFYESRLGFLAEILVYGTAFLSYLLIRKMREVNEARYQSKSKRWKWEDWLLKKVPFLDNVVVGFMPRQNTKQYFKLSKLLKDSNSMLKMEWLTLHRIVLTVSVFLLLVGGFWFAHEREKASTLFTIVPESLFAGNVSDEDYEAFKETTAFDRRVIEDIQKMDGLTPEMLQAHVAKQLGDEEVYSPRVKQAYDRIVEKWTIVENAFLKWEEVLFAVLVSIGMWFLPTGILHFQRYLRYKDMENEVHQFLVLISILREFDRMSVYTLLVWLERLGVVFRDPIQETLQIYDAGPEEALDFLSEKVQFEPFNQIVERLKLSIVRISIKEAFDDIDTEREFYLEQREEANHRSLESKGAWASILGMAPTVVLTFLYLVGPLIYLSVIESQGMLLRIQ